MLFSHERSERFARFFFVAVLMTACDVRNTPHDQATIGPPISILGTNLGTEGTVPADGVIQVAFDRYLLPSTITRQSYVIVDSTNQALGNLPLRTVYDPVARTVTIVGPDGPDAPWLTVDQSYKLVLPVPTANNSDLGGFRAIDRATLRADQKREFVFRAGPPTHQAHYEPTVDFCADVMPIFQAKCNGALCHGVGTTAAAGLVLTSRAGIIDTARGRVAQGANTSARAFSPEPPNKIFGVNMAVIEPYDPGSSWLMYKIEMAPPPVVTTVARPPILCSLDEASPPSPASDLLPLATAKTTVDETERSILNDYVLGQPMPYPANDASHPTYAFQPLTFQERERVRIWIARGAETPECVTCKD